MSREMYFNFPVTLLQGFMDDRQRKKSLRHILYYVTFRKGFAIARSQSSFHPYNDTWVGFSCDDEKLFAFEEAMNGLAWSFSNESDYVDDTILNNVWHFEEEETIEEAVQIGERIYESTKRVAKAGISRRIFWDYYHNQKNKWQLAELLGFLALKSIVGKAKYKKVVHTLLLARMSGHNRVNEGRIDPLVKEFMTEHRLRELKKRLADHWGMKKNGRIKSRGFWVSFDSKVSLDELTIVAMRSSKKNREKRQQKQEDRAYLKALVAIAKEEQRRF